MIHILSHFLEVTDTWYVIKAQNEKRYVSVAHFDHDNQYNMQTHNTKNLGKKVQDNKSSVPR